jgi:hypothetical protein
MSKPLFDIVTSWDELLIGIAKVRYGFIWTDLGTATAELNASIGIDDGWMHHSGFKYAVLTKIDAIAAVRA